MTLFGYILGTFFLSFFLIHSFLGLKLVEGNLNGEVFLAVGNFVVSFWIARVILHVLIVLIDGDEE